MHPVLFKIGSFELHSYGLMLALAFLVGVWMSAKRGKAQGLNPNYLMDLAAIIILSAIVGSRLLYVVFHLEEFRGHWADTFNPFQSSGEIGIAGLTFLGGLILAIVTSFVYLWWRRMSFLKTADVIMPALAFGLFLGRIGCFLNGCCFGVACSGPQGVIFPPNSPAGATFPDTPIHPTQLYASLSGLAIFALLLWLERKKTFDGYLFFWTLVLYGVARFTIDFFRYYEPNMVAFHALGCPISVNQVISVFMIAAGLFFIVRNSRRVGMRSA